MRCTQSHGTERGCRLDRAAVGSVLLQRVQQPVFSLLDGEASAAFDVALTQAGCSGATPTPTPAFTSAPRLAQAKLQRMLRADAAMPVRGLGLEAFTECLLALQEAPKPRASVFGDDDESDGDSSAGGGDGSRTGPCSRRGSPSAHSVAPLAISGTSGGGGAPSGRYALSGRRNSHGTRPGAGWPSTAASHHPGLVTISGNT